MNNFQYYNPAEIIFGRDAEQKLKLLLERHGVKSLLLVYSGDFIKDLGIWDVVREACEALGISFLENGSVTPNPNLSLVQELIAQGRQHQVDFVLAVGGGSAIDTAKTVAAGIPYDGDVWDFFTGAAQPKAALPVGVISTLPASGSETSNCAIITNGLNKLGIEDNLITPVFAIMNPEFTLGLPAYQTACGIADILSHLLERYFSDVAHTDTTDFLIEGAIQALLLNSRRVIQNPKDYNVRAEIQWLGSIAHNNLLDTGRTADWGSHRIEHELSGQYNLTHGEGMAVVLTAWTKYAAEHKPEKLAQLANRVFHVDYHDYTLREMALRLSAELEQFFRSLQLKTHLTELGIDDTDFVTMALRATNDGTETVGHYIPLDQNKMIEILHLAL